MATNTTLLQHPLHEQHPLKPRDFSKSSNPPLCHLCNWKISADGYACEGCRFFSHGVCAEAPPRIDKHPLHADHPLTLLHRPPPFISNVCDLCDSSHDSWFRCDECDFNLDTRCAVSTLSDRGGSNGKTTELIMLPLHHHTLTSFHTRHDFIGESNCVICKGSVEMDGYVCLNWQCEFLIHKRCVQDLCYTNGQNAPLIYHRHPLEIFQRKDKGSIICARCQSDESSGEFIGCVECGVFCCRDCLQVPESIHYPCHPEHNLVLLINPTDDDKLQCYSCSFSLKGTLCYGCLSCELFAHVQCSFHVLTYCEEGMTAEIELSWHKHPLHLCHRKEYYRRCCSYCRTPSADRMYACKDKACNLLLHKGCAEMEPTMVHPHHPDHPLTLCSKSDAKKCKACGELIRDLRFSCHLCSFHLHAKCSSLVPTLKHSIHEHEFLHLEIAPSLECNRCEMSTSAPLVRCIICDFNLHKTCMELPLDVLNSKVHRHPLTLHEIFLEDGSEEYYCDYCERTMDRRLGVYVCGKCKISPPLIFHIHCVFPELEIYERESQASVLRRLNRLIKKKDEELSAAEETIEKVKGELDELKKSRDELIA